MSGTPTRSNPVDAAYRVSERCSAEKVDGMLLDLTTARAIITVFEALSPERRGKMESLTVAQAGTLAWRLAA